MGAPDAGKSAIIQAFHYVREILEHNNLDADKVTSGGDFIDLGGFKNFVHNHDISKDVTFRFDMECEDGLDFNEYFVDYQKLSIKKC